MATVPMNIVLAEDDDGHATLIQRNLERVGLVNGFTRLKADERTAGMPVIILTTTDDPREIERCYELGCNVYITKPVEYDAFIEAVRRLGFFLQVVKLPPGHRFVQARPAGTQ